MAFNKEKVMDGARKLAEKNQLDKAVKEYLRVVQEDPNDLRVWLKIGDLHIKRGSKQDATEVYLQVARVYQEQGFLQKAVAVYKQVLKIDPHLVDVNLKLAELFRQLGLIGDAMQHFEAVAGHFHRDGNTKEALATVRQLVDLDPENVATRIKLAELYSKEGLTAEAIAEFTTATDQLRKQGRQDDFIKVSERLLWHQPGNIDLARELAALYLGRNDARRALQKLQTCFKADSRDVETLAMLAQAFQALDQTSKTVSVLKELARIHDENKQSAKADAVFRKILEFSPRDADAQARLGGKAAAPPAQVAQPVAQRQPAPAALLARNQVTFGNQDPPPPANRRMTGAVPLIDDAQFALTPTPSVHDFASEDSSYRDGSIAGEEHAEEIAKTLAETDVYLKYGLHQKAIDHLRRVFTLDPDNFEARERLKDVYVAQGRDPEALLELVALAEASAPVDPARAAGYVLEALAIDGSHAPSLELADRHRLDLRQDLRQSEQRDAQRPRPESGVIPVDDFLDDDEFGDLAYEAPAGATAIAGPGYGGGRLGSIDDDFDPNDLIAPQGSPMPMRRDSGAGLRPMYMADDDFSIDDGANMPQETRQVSAAAVQAMAHATLDSDDLEFEQGMGAPASSSYGAIGTSRRTPSPAEPVEPAAVSLTGSFDEPLEDLPFDPAAARAFDAYVAPTSVASSLSASEPVTSDGPVLVAAPAILEDELDEADFYVAQNMFSQAREVLGALLDRYPGHRLVEVKLAEVDRLEAGDDPAAPFAEPFTDSRVAPFADGGETYVGGAGVEVEFTGDAVRVDASDLLSEAPDQTEALDLDDIEEIDPDELELEPELEPELEVASSDDLAAELSDEFRGGSTAGGRPAVMLERPVDDADADTHYDLGQAYKEMGLLEAAVQAFEKAVHGPSREVQARMMIGLCLREQGNERAAISQFNQALHAAALTELEQRSLYYELGVSHDALGELGEALYFLQLVGSSNGAFADLDTRIARLRSSGAVAQASSTKK